MVAGQSSKLKIGAIIQARMSSTRMPGKSAMNLPFPNGKPLLKWITDEVKKSQQITDIAIASSEHPANEAIEKFAQQENIYCFRGDENNVLSRFTHLATALEVDYIVRLTADDPFLDIRLLDQLISHHIKQQNDYTLSNGLPLGMNFEIITASALLALKNEELSDDEREHVTLALEKDGYKKENISLNSDETYTQMRLTVDYPSDFVVASQILSLLADNQSPDFEFIKETSKKYPWLFSINTANKQL